MSKINQLTFTRYIAAITVVFFHYASDIESFNSYPFNKILLSGPTMVTYFFVLSGFIMALNYHCYDKQFNTLNFYIRRFARIYPVYIFSVFLMGSVVIEIGNNTLFAFILNIFMLQAWIPPYPITFNYPGWSLSVEAFMYLIVPLLVMASTTFTKKQTLTIGILFWLFTQIIHIWVINSYTIISPSINYDFYYYNPLIHVNTFILGYVFGTWFKDNRSALSRLVPISPIFIGILSCLLLYLLINTNNIIELKYDYAVGMLAPLFVLFIMFLSIDKSVIKKTLCNRWLVLLGDSSYSIYILHVPVYSIFSLFFPYMSKYEELNFLTYIVILTLISIYSMKKLENPTRESINSYFSTRKDKVTNE